MQRLKLSYIHFSGRKSSCDLDVGDVPSVPLDFSFYSGRRSFYYDGMMNTTYDKVIVKHHLNVSLIFYDFQVNSSSFTDFVGH